MPTPPRITRRQLLALLPAATAVLHAPLFAQTHLFSRKPKPVPVVSHPLVYFGTDTDKPGAKGIYVSRFDSAHGQLTSPILAAPALRPSFLALGPLRSGRRMLYSVNEGGDAKTSMVSAFEMNLTSGALQPLNQVSSGGASPCYLALDGTGHSAYVANYNGGTIGSFIIRPDGTLSPAVERIDFHDEKVFGSHGPVAARQEGPHPHSALISPDNRFLIVNDLGGDAIVTFAIDPNTARLGPPTVTDSRTPGSGPRHLAFHPNGRWAYGIDELSSNIDQYLWNATHATSGAAAIAHLTDTGRSISTLDPSFHGTNTAAEIVVSGNGFFVYASNRGEDSLVVFTVDQKDGALALAQRIACGGKAPRHFTLDPTGRWLLCGNQDSASVTVFARDPGTGRLTGPVQTLPIEAPQFTLFA